MFLRFWQVLVSYWPEPVELSDFDLQVRPGLFIYIKVWICALLNQFMWYCKYLICLFTICNICLTPFFIIFYVKNFLPWFDLILLKPKWLQLLLNALSTMYWQLQIISMNEVVLVTKQNLWNKWDLFFDMGLKTQNISIFLHDAFVLDHFIFKCKVLKIPNKNKKQFYLLWQLDVIKAISNTLTNIAVFRIWWRK